MEGPKMVPVLMVISMLAVVMSARGVFVDAQDMTELPGTRICQSAYMQFKTQDVAAQAAVDDVVAHTSGPGYHRKTRKYAGTPLVGDTAWAIGACNGKLQKAQCDRCMKRASDLLHTHCARKEGLTKLKRGAQIKLQDCRLRWELYDFNW